MVRWDEDGKQLVGFFPTVLDITLTKSYLTDSADKYSKAMGVVAEKDLFWNLSTY